MSGAIRSIFLVGLFLTLCAVADGQRSSTVGNVCGDPTAACRTRESFQAYELPFDFGKGNAVIAESKPFYAVILKSVKLKTDQSDCAGKFPEAERLDAQLLFPNNMVFVMRCNEAVQNYYTNVANNTSFMAVYAGKSMAEANRFFAKVKAVGKFNGAVVRRMRVGINGT